MDVLTAAGTGVESTHRNAPIEGVTVMPSRLAIFLSLLVLLALTRWGHFGTRLSLPDASLAVFLLGGLWLARARAGGLGYFAALMLCAFAIDVYLAQTATEAGWCLTPAYWGLLPTYAVMWFTGRWLALSERGSKPLPFALAGLAATGAAFVISNVTFWAFSGQFGAMGAVEYAQAVARYFPPYLGSTALYLALGWAAQRWLFSRPNTAAA